MSKIADQHYLLADQYRDATNLDARVRLHVLFSTNKYGWNRWYFDRLDLPPRARVLELGCGPGHLWRDNLDRIPVDWDVALSDFRQGWCGKPKRSYANTNIHFVIKSSTRNLFRLMTTLSMR